MLIPIFTVSSDQTVVAKGHTGAVKLREGISRKDSPDHDVKLFSVLRYV